MIYSQKFLNRLFRENTEASVSSEEMLSANTTTLGNMGFSHVEPGAFASDERTDLGNVDKNRAAPAEDAEPVRSNVDQGEEEVAVVSTTITTEPCPVCGEVPCICGEENPEDEFEDELMKLGLSSVTLESSQFNQAFERILRESDYEGVKQWNNDFRVTANQVLRRLKAELPGVIGIHVDADKDENENSIFYVSGPDWEKQDAELPQTLDVENVKLKLSKEKDGYRYIYTIDGVNSGFPVVK